MLSRVADSLFWMGRYLERAEVVARLLDVGSNLELDLAGLVPYDYTPPWKGTLEVLHQILPDALQDDASVSSAVAAWLSFEIDNPASILAAVNRGRNNARGIRGRISSEMWRSLNQLYWKLRDPEFVGVAKHSPHDYYTEVQIGSQGFQGVCDATLPHDEGWHFIQLGKYLERADKTIKLLDVKYRQLSQLKDDADQPLVTLEWAGVLKSCNSFEAYQRIYISRVERERVIEFLLLDAESPRSVRFCLESAARALKAIDTDPRRDAPAEKALGRVISDLRYADLNHVLAGDFHGFLSGLLSHCNLTSKAIQNQYSLVN
ncbi:alpha-E domain-containing protein [soil metagenome]